MAERIKLEQRRVPMVPCSVCDGLGTQQFIDLRLGAKWVLKSIWNPYEFEPPMYEGPCERCKGKGRVRIDRI